MTEREIPLSRNIKTEIDTIVSDTMNEGETAARRSETMIVVDAATTDIGTLLAECTTITKAQDHTRVIDRR